MSTAWHDLRPSLHPDPYVFAQVPEVPPDGPFAVIREDEGVTLVLARAQADRLGLPYGSVAARTDDVVVTLPDLDESFPLPEAPWFEPGARWSARRALLHIAAETAQHAGHADIIRETLDGSKTMG